MNTHKEKTDDDLVRIASASREIDGASVEMTRRLKDSIEKLDLSTTKYNKFLIFLTTALLALGVIQTLITIILSNQPIWLIIAGEIFFGSIFIFVLKDIRKELLK